jgi:hypothetical protein
MRKIETTMKYVYLVERNLHLAVTTYHCRSGEDCGKSGINAAGSELEKE